MKYCKVAGLILTAVLLGSCSAKSINQNSNKIEHQEKKMEKIEREFISNGYAIDCPEEYKAVREGVTYGTVIHKTYYSKTCKMERPCSILLPPSYSESKKYPVVYFQHGIFGDENCMINDGSNYFKEITGNLAAEGKAPEMIFVFGHMYATDDPEQKPGFDSKAVLPYDNFINELTNDLMPYIESNFSVLTGRENTAICGFSMGGRETLYIGLQRSDLFAYVGAIAPAPGLVPAKDWAMEHKGMISEDEVKFKAENPLPELLMVCCGTNDGTVGQFPRSYHSILTKNNVNHTWFEVMNADHNSHAIRTGLFYFVSNIFKTIQ